MNHFPRRAQNDIYRRRIEATARYYRSNGCVVSEDQIQAALDLSGAWRAAALVRGVTDVDLEGPTSLSEEALDAVLAADRRILEAETCHHWDWWAGELDDPEPPGLA